MILHFGSRLLSFALSQAPNCSVVDHCWPEKHGRWSVVVGAGYPYDEDVCQRPPPPCWAK